MRNSFDIRFFFERFGFEKNLLPIERTSLLFLSLIPEAKRQLLTHSCEANEPVND
jgi:hypothetical protein